MQNAWLWEEVLAAGACFLPLVPASFCFAVPSLMTACLRMQTGLVKGPVRQFPAHRLCLVCAGRAACYRPDLLLVPQCCSLRCSWVRRGDTSAANPTSHHCGGRDPLLLGSSTGASCPRCCCNRGCGIPSEGGARGGTPRWVFTPWLLRAGLF